MLAQERSSSSTFLRMHLLSEGYTIVYNKSADWRHFGRATWRTENVWVIPLCSRHIFIHKHVRLCAHAHKLCTDANRGQREYWVLWNWTLESCGQTNLGAGHWIWVLQKSEKCSYLLSHFSNPPCVCPHLSNTGEGPLACGNSDVLTFTASLADQAVVHTLPVI